MGDTINWCRNKDCMHIDLNSKASDKDGWYSVCNLFELDHSKEGKCLMQEARVENVSI